MGELPVPARVTGGGGVGFAGWLVAKGIAEGPAVLIAAGNKLDKGFIGLRPT